MTTSENKIIVWMQVSLDGRTQGPNGEFDWPDVGPELNAHFVDTLRDAGMFLYGRKVFDMMAGFWPIAEDLPDSTPLQRGYSKIWKPMPKLVFSRSLDTADWNSTVLGDIDDRIADHRTSANGDLYLFGGSEVVGEFARRDLIDEYQLFVHPVVLGGGAPLFPELQQRQDMSLIETKVFDGRVNGLRYARSR